MWGARESLLEFPKNVIKSETRYRMNKTRRQWRIRIHNAPRIPLLRIKAEGCVLLNYNVYMKAPDEKISMKAMVRSGENSPCSYCLMGMSQPKIFISPWGIPDVYLLKHCIMYKFNPIMVSTQEKYHELS